MSENTHENEKQLNELLKVRRDKLFDLQSKIKILLK